MFPDPGFATFEVMASPAPERMTLAEFLQWDDGTDRRYELLDGLAMMMAPSLEAHGDSRLPWPRKSGLR